MATFYVKTVYESGRPARGCRVAISFHGFWRGLTKEVWTNDDGIATFSDYDPGDADIIVDGTTRLRHVYVQDGSMFTVTVKP
ncbi:MAG: hypothetical protein N2508_15700 [Anaerolineae bacterium]|nr:hypothetical protein [Anaerolineae bacterium]